MDAAVEDGATDKPKLIITPSYKGWPADKTEKFVARIEDMAARGNWLPRGSGLSCLVSRQRIVSYVSLSAEAEKALKGEVKAVEWFVQVNTQQHVSNPNLYGRIRPLALASYQTVEEGYTTPEHIVNKAGVHRPCATCTTDHSSVSVAPDLNEA